MIGKNSDVSYNTSVEWLMTLTIGGEDICFMQSFVGASYDVHHDMHSHTGGAISWGTGLFLTKCSKQKLNTKSLTEAKVVQVSDFLPNVIWMRVFLGSQGYQVHSNILYQDNQSAVKIEINGKSSCGQKL